MKKPQTDLERLTNRALVQYLTTAPSADELEFIADLRQRSERYAPGPRAWTDEDDALARTLWAKQLLGLDHKWQVPSHGLYSDAGWQRVCDDYEAALAASG